VKKNHRGYDISKLFQHVYDLISHQQAWLKHNIPPGVIAKIISQKEKHVLLPINQRQLPHTVNDV
jgi:hypothetical protein